MNRKTITLAPTFWLPIKYVNLISQPGSLFANKRKSLMLAQCFQLHIATNTYHQGGDSPVCITHSEDEFYFLTLVFLTGVSICLLDEKNVYSES